MQKRTPVVASECVIQQATVQIKMLTVGSKQMTLAVFRQLPDRPLIDLTRLDVWPECLNGMAWGRVNYHVDCPTIADYDSSGNEIATYKPSHIHIIWEQEGTLYRDAVIRIVHQAFSASWDDMDVEVRLEVRNEWKRVIDYLEGLDQLFIAV